MGEYLVDQRRFNAMVLAAVVLAYAVSLFDAKDWVWAPLLIPVSVFAARVVVPRIPAWLLMVVTTAIVVPINIDLNAEGSFFLVCMAGFALAAESDRWLPDRLLVAAGALSPLVDVAIGHDEVRNWNWPFWSMGILVSSFFGAVLLHQRGLTIALAEAQSRLAHQAAGEERRRIAREVHDLVGHSLTVVLLHVTGARRLVRRDPDEAEAALEDAERAGRAALSEIRSTVSLLREDGQSRAPTPGVADIAGLVEDSAAAGMRITHHIAPGLETLDESTGLAVYRIVQESLANAAHHAPGATTTVTIEPRDGSLLVEVINGSPTRPAHREPGAGTGVVGMQERALAVGGSLAAAADGRGWRVAATLPLDRRVPEITP